MSVEETRGRIDCGTQGAPGAVNPERFRGVRIFDISDLASPVQLPGVQTCRGSHTHTIVADPDDPDNLYIYNSGTAGVRSPLELAGCENAALTTASGDDRQPDPVADRRHQGAARRPGDGGRSSASRGSSPTPTTGAFNGLQNTLPGTRRCSTRRAPYTRRRPTPTPATTSRPIPSIGLAAGACHGNGILLDISDPVNPVRLDAVVGPELLVLALGDAQQRRDEGDLHRRVGRRHVAPDAA